VTRYSFGALAKLRALAKNIDVEVAGIADVPAYIDEFIDVEGNSSNQLFVPGNGFSLHGHNIKAGGDDPSYGVYFVPVEDPSKKVKVTRILENTPTKIMGIIPPSTGFLLNRIEIVTQYSSSGTTMLKAPRVITSSFTIEET
jgi:hypothetical protein